MAALLQQQHEQPSQPTTDPAMKGEPWAGSLEDTTGGTRPPPPPPAGGASRYVDRQDLPDMPDYRLVH